MHVKYLYLFWSGLGQAWQNNAPCFQVGNTEDSIFKAWSKFPSSPDSTAWLMVLSSNHGDIIWMYKIWPALHYLMQTFSCVGRKREKNIYYTVSGVISRFFTSSCHKRTLYFILMNEIICFIYLCEDIIRGCISVFSLTGYVRGRNWCLYVCVPVLLQHMCSVCLCFCFLIKFYSWVFMSRSILGHGTRREGNNYIPIFQILLLP